MEVAAVAALVKSRLVIGAPKNLQANLTATRNGVEMITLQPDVMIILRDVMIILLDVMIPPLVDGENKLINKCCH